MKKKINLFYCILILVLQYGCSLSPDNEVQIETEFLLTNSSISPFYISAGKDSFLLNCTSDDSNDNQLSYLLDNKLNVRSRRTVPFDNEFYLPSLYYKKNIYLAEHGFSKWKKAIVQEDVIHQDSLTKSYKTLFEMPDGYEQFLGSYKSTKILSKGDTVIRLDQDRVIWKVANIDVKYFCTANNILVVNNPDGIYFIELDSGKSYPPVLRKDNEFMKKQRGRIIVYSASDSTITFTVDRGSDQIYSYNFKNSKLLWKYPLQQQATQYNWISNANAFLNCYSHGYTFILSGSKILIFDSNGFVKSVRLKKKYNPINYFFREDKLFIVSNNGYIYSFKTEHLII